MALTPEGIAMYDSLMNLPYDGNSLDDKKELCQIGVAYYYMALWYEMFHCGVDCPDPDTMTMCFNSLFIGSEPVDTFLSGWKLYDGYRSVNFDCDIEDIDFLPLPEEVVPNPPPISEYEFNLNPVDNADPLDLPTTEERKMANFHSFEIMSYTTSKEPIITGLIETIPPSGNRSIKINNDHVNRHANKMSRKFTVDLQNSIYYFSYALVMEDPEHQDFVQPFFTASVRDSQNNIIQQICYISDPSDPRMDFTITSSFQRIVYRNWACDSFDLTDYIGQDVIVEFISADCGGGLHFGYAYVADICEPCSSLPEITLDSTAYPCPEFPIEFCGNLKLPINYDLINLEMEIARSTTKKAMAVLSSYDTLSGDYCFSIPQSIADTLPDNGYDVFAIATLINPSGDTVILKSVTANPNSQNVYNNDFEIGNPDCGCDVEIEANLAVNFCLMSGEYEEQVMSVVGSIRMPTGYTDCGYQPTNVQGGYFTFSQWFFDGINIRFDGVFNITDYSLIETNGDIVIFDLVICDKITDEECTAVGKMSLLTGQFGMCEDGGIMCDNFSLNWSFGYPNLYQGNVYNHFNFLFPFVNKKDQPCTINQYTAEVWINFGETNNSLYSTDIFTAPSVPYTKFWSKFIIIPEKDYDEATSMTLKFWNNCGDTCTLSIPFLPVNDGSGGKKLAGNNPLRPYDIFPNPAKDELIVRYANSFERGMISVIDINGQEVLQNIELVDDTSTQIDVSSLKPGIYILKLESMFGQFPTIFVKE